MDKKKKRLSSHEIVREALKAARVCKDPELRKIAFDRVLWHLLREETYRWNR